MTVPETTTFVYPRRNGTVTLEGTLVGESRTRDGAPVAFYAFFDVEGPNRGFIAHDFCAFIDGEKVGYLTVGYVPNARFGLFNPTIFNYIDNFGGGFPGLGSPFDEDVVDPSRLEGDAFHDFARKALSHLRHRGPVPDDLDIAGLEALLADNQTLQRHLADRRAFVAHHIDRPLVGYVNTKGNANKGLSCDHSGRGIGVLLYLVTARRLADEGLFLHASSLQSDKAASIWERFSRAGWTTRRDRGKRLVLDPCRLPDISNPQAFFAAG